MISPKLRILSIGDNWYGSDAWGFVNAFRRDGHSVQVIPEKEYIPLTWTGFFMKVIARSIRNLAVKQFNQCIVQACRTFQPNLLFVFKGTFVEAKTIIAIKKQKIVCINFYPDVSFLSHGKWLPQSLPHYHWIFNSKSFGLKDLKDKLQVSNASLLLHGFDPEIHSPRLPFDEKEIKRYSCQVSFIGAWSPKKQKLLEFLYTNIPELDLKIWGVGWLNRSPGLKGCIQNQQVLGLEYAKAIYCSQINIGILCEKGLGTSDGDRTTARSFHIPASGGFMLHERTPEFIELFRENIDCGCFSDQEELVDKVRYYLKQPKLRNKMANSGRKRCLEKGYSFDHRSKVITDKVREYLQ